MGFALPLAYCNAAEIQLRYDAAMTMNRLLRHMSWANQRVFSSIQGLPQQALDSHIVNSEWSAKHILQHIVSGADWFAYWLTEADWHDIKLPREMSDVADIAKQLADFDAVAIGESEKPDELITRDVEGKLTTNLRSTVLAQAVHHATEHRAQLIDALEFKGYKPINLDDIDLWNFESFEKNQRQASFQTPLNALVDVNFKREPLME